MNKNLDVMLIKVWRVAFCLVLPSEISDFTIAQSSLFSCWNRGRPCCQPFGLDNSVESAVFAVLVDDHMHAL